MISKPGYLFVTAVVLCMSVTNIYAINPKDSQGVIKEISEYVSPQNIPSRPQTPTFLPNGTEYALLSDDNQRIETYDIKTGQKTGVLMDVTHVREEQIADIETYTLSPDASKILVSRDSKPIYRRSSTARNYVYDIRSRILMPLSKEFANTRIPCFSPDSRMVAFVAENNVYVKKIDFNTEVQVTTDGKYGSIINGATDWTYEEEFQLTSTLSWSDDSQTLCFVRFDETDVPEYTLPIYEGTCPAQNEYQLYPGQLSYKYPVAGCDNSTFVIISYDIDNRKCIELPLPSNDIAYLPRIDFGGSDGKLLVTTLNRDQNKLEIYSVDPRTTVAKSVFAEKSKAWIIPEMYENIVYGKESFTIMSGRSGYVHLYRYGYNGTLLETITQGEYDVTQYYGSDALGNHYYQSAQPTPLDRTIHRYDSRKHTDKILGEASGTNSASFDKTLSYGIFNHSNVDTPPVYSLINTNGAILRVIENNESYKMQFANKMVKKEFITISTENGTLNAYIIKPSDFTSTEKYPLVMTQYSGPGSQSVLNKWEMDWMNYFVSKGFVVACVDGRGTGGRGMEWMQCVYMNLGKYETIDQINAANYFASLPWIDGKRIGICGWSYGGYETLMCATDALNPFKAAVAIAPVTDWRFYDTVYTERYMLTPQQNDNGYNVSAPLNRAYNLSASTLIMYGTEDDNVHPANSLQFVSQLQNNLMTCDMFVFPNKNHSIYGCGARAVVYGNMFNYFKLNL